METKNLLKSLKRRLGLITVILATLAVSQGMYAATTRIYAKMTYDWWKVDGAAIGAHSWGNPGPGTSWPGVRMTPVEGETDMWYIDLDTEKVQNVIFTRVNGSGTIADWGAKTKDLTIPTNGNNFFTITSSSEVWGDPGCDGEWSTYPPCPKPTLTGITGDDSNLEQGSQHTYTATEADAGTGATISTYNWTLPDGWSGTSTTNTIDATVGNSAGQKTIKCSVTNSCGSTSDEVSKTVTVAEKYYIAGNGDGSGTAGKWCDGKSWNATGSEMSGSPASVTFNNVAACSDNYCYEFKVTKGDWDHTIGWGDHVSGTGVTFNTSASSGANIQFKISQTSNITITCDGTNITVTAVSACDTPDAPTITGTTDVCSGSNTTLTSSNQYTKWYVGSTLKYTGETYTTDAITSNITVEAKAYISGDESCLSDATQKDITKKDKPAQPGEISGTSVLCTGQTYSNQFSITEVATATSYTWSKSGEGDFTVTGNGLNCTVITGENYTGGTLQVVAVNGCGNSIARTLTLTKSPDPTVSLSASQSSVCAGSNVTITATTTNVNTYSWTVAGWKEVSKDKNQAVYTTTGSGATTITYTGTNTCSVSKSGSTTVTVIKIPTAGTVSATVTSMCPDGSSTLSATGTSGATSYQWQKSTTSASDGFENISGATNATYTVSGLTAGSYWFRLVVKNDGNCSGTSNAVPVTVNPAPNLSVTVSSTAITASETDKTYGWEYATFTASSSTDGATITGGITQTTGTGGIIEGNKAKGHVGDAFTGSYTATKDGCSTDAQKTVTVIKAEEVCNN